MYSYKKRRIDRAKGQVLRKDNSKNQVTITRHWWQARINDSSTANDHFKEVLTGPRCITTSKTDCDGQIIRHRLMTSKDCYYMNCSIISCVITPGWHGQSFITNGAVNLARVRGRAKSLTTVGAMRWKSHGTNSRAEQLGIQPVEIAKPLMVWLTGFGSLSRGMVSFCTSVAVARMQKSRVATLRDVVFSEASPRCSCQL